MAPGIMPLPCCRAMPRKSDGAKKPASETVPDQRWKLQVFYLCFYGFMTQIRPGESFITPYLLGADKNFTKEEVSCGHPVPHPGVPVDGRDCHPGATQRILPWFWVHRGVMSWAWWCVVARGGAFWGGRWCGVLWGPVSLACEVTLSLSPRLNLPWHKTSCPGWQLIWGGSV